MKTDKKKLFFENLLIETPDYNREEHLQSIKGRVKNDPFDKIAKLLLAASEFVKNQKI